ncbi:hypothetical protein EU527_14670 [Candidatus Thorarchaeota archaeon]|nr:MAG: hypothetical protein EU527_14670 [Candidatus Thorarchaeota archaeon]
MTSDRNNQDLSKILRGIESQLKSIHSVLSGLEQRIDTLEQSVGHSGYPQRENPLIYSKVLMRTLQAIEDFERERGHGVVAKDLAAIRDVELPTIYDHLAKLEETSFVFWQRGAELGLKPHNAKFYSVTNREDHLTELPVLMALPDEVVPIAQAVVKSSQNGISRSNLLESLQKLKNKGEKNWKDMSSNDLEKQLDKGIRLLMRRVLIKRKRDPEDEYYYLWEQ